MHIYALTPVNLLPAKNMHLSCYADTWMNKLIQMQMCFSDNLINTGKKFCNFMFNVVNALM